MIYGLKVDDEAFAHLRPQRGALWGLTNERERWLTAYKRDLHDTFRAMHEHLPPNGSKPAVLDIGAGMGGLDVYLWRRYGKGTRLCLLDHIGGEPSCIGHDQPFGDLTVSRRFLLANGVDMDDIVLLGPGIRGAAPHPAHPMFDVVVSTRAWCFHFEPAEYLAWVVSRLKPGGVVLVDLRHGREDWLQALVAALGPVRAVAQRQRKCDLLVFRP
jgi:SAM-dependent methyltransferase